MSCSQFMTARERLDRLPHLGRKQPTTEPPARLRAATSNRARGFYFTERGESMDEFKRDFKGVWIPKVVWLDGRLSALDKIILTEIDSLDQGESGCYASNKYIAEFCQCSETKVSTAVSKLVKLGYLYVQSFDGRQRILKSSLSKIESLPFGNCNAAPQNLKESNIDNNTFTNTKKKERAASRFTPPTVEEVRAYCIERRNSVDAQRFVDYYTANGWKVGRNSMKDWKATVRTWERNGYSSGRKQQPQQNRPETENDRLRREQDEQLLAMFASYNGE